MDRYGGKIPCRFFNPQGDINKAIYRCGSPVRKLALDEGGSGRFKDGYAVTSPMSKDEFLKKYPIGKKCFALEDFQACKYYNEENFKKYIKIKKTVK